MATKRYPASGTLSAYEGKFYFQLVYSFTGSGTNWSLKVVVTDALKTAKKATASHNITKDSKTFKAKGTHTIVGGTYTASQTTKQFEISYAGKSHTFAAVTNTSNKPADPTSISASKPNDAQINITVKGGQFKLSPTNRIEIERCRDVKDASSFTPIPNSPFAVSGKYSYTATDASSDIERNARYWFRARAVNAASGKVSAWKTTGEIYTTPTNEAITGDPTVQRVDNNSAKVSWEISSVVYVTRKLLTKFILLRSDNDGAYKQIGTVNANSQHTAYSFTDTTCQPDHSYKYALKCVGTGGTAEVPTQSSETIYMSPSAPQDVKAAQNSDGSVVLTIANISLTATAVCIERSVDGGAYSQIAEETYPIASYLDEEVDATDTVKYRIRNKCDQLTGDAAYSLYRESNIVQQKSKPYKPDLKTPVNASFRTLDEGTVRLTWQHKPSDGSAQEEAELQYKINDGAYRTEEFTTESYYDLDISNLSAGDSVTWRVRTKGAHVDFSDYSDAWIFGILTKPEITFTAPETGTVIDTLPVSLAWTYSDLSGTLTKLTADVVKDGEIVKIFDVPVGTGESGAYEFSLAGFLFENNTTYGITATATSSTGFTSVADISIHIQYEEVSLEGGLIPTVEFDDDAIAHISIERDITETEEGEEPEPIEIAESYLYKVHDGERELMASELEDSSVIEDKFAPINVPYVYELLMLTADGQVSIVSTEQVQFSNQWYVYFGDKIARAKWNPTGDVSLSRPEKTQIRYSGRKYPVSYDSDAIEETFSFSAAILDREELINFKRLMREGGRGIWKSGDGDVYEADFNFSYSADFKGSQRVWEAKLEVTRIEV